MANTKHHRIDRPVVKYANGSKEWWIDGKLHRTDGHAIECADGRKYWYVNGVKIDIEKIVSTYDLSPDWTQWTESEKVLFRLAL